MSSFHGLDERLRSEPGSGDYVRRLEFEEQRNEVLAKHFREMMIPPNVSISLSIDEATGGGGGVGGAAASNAGLACFDISIHPHFALWLKQTVMFRCTVDTNCYPTIPPKVMCLTPLRSIELPEGSGEDPYEDGYWRPLEDEDEKPIIEDDGTVRRMTLIRGEDDEELFREGWLDHYELGSVIHALWFLFKPPSEQGGSPPFGTLYKPALQLESWAVSGFDDADGDFAWASTHYEEQGARTSMEDAGVAVDSLVLKRPIPRDRLLGLWAVFDGHGGSVCSKHVAERFSAVFAAALEEQMPDFCLRTALWNTFFRIDKAFLDFVKAEEEKGGASETSGTTACVVCATSAGYIYCANCGDSRAVLGRAAKGGSFARTEAIALSEDHKPTRADETARVVQEGGFVISGRVMGQIAVSRAFGDMDFKYAGQTTLTCEPEITEIAMSERDRFLVIACDGLWDVMSNQEVVDFVAEAKAEGSSMKTIAEEIVHHAIEDLGSTDNVSIILIDVQCSRAPTLSEGSVGVAQGSGAGTTGDHNAAVHGRVSSVSSKYARRPGGRKLSAAVQKCAKASHIRRVSRGEVPSNDVRDTIVKSDDSELKKLQQRFFSKQKEKEKQRSFKRKKSRKVNSTSSPSSSSPAAVSSSSSTSSSATTGKSIIAEAKRKLEQARAASNNRSTLVRGTDDADLMALRLRRAAKSKGSGKSFKARKASSKSSTVNKGSKAVSPLFKEKAGTLGMVVKKAAASKLIDHVRKASAAQISNLGSTAEQEEEEHDVDAPPPEGAFYYNGEGGIEYGPFTTARMRQWIEHDYLEEDLMLRNGGPSRPFQPLYSYSELKL